MNSEIVLDYGCMIRDIKTWIPEPWTDLVEIVKVNGPTYLSIKDKDKVKGVAVMTRVDPSQRLFEPPCYTDCLDMLKRVITEEIQQLEYTPRININVQNCDRTDNGINKIKGKIYIGLLGFDSVQFANTFPYYSLKIRYGIEVDTNKEITWG